MTSLELPKLLTTSPESLISVPRPNMLMLAFDADLGKRNPNRHRIYRFNHIHMQILEFCHKDQKSPESIQRFEINTSLLFYYYYYYWDYLYLRQAL